MPAPVEPALGLAVVTCMDVRLDVLAILGLRHGDAHVLRNAGGRVTDDVLRSLALSSHLFGTSAVLVMQHTGCGLAGRTEDELRRRTGVDDIALLAIEDHHDAIEADVAAVVDAPYLDLVRCVTGVLHDLATGTTTEVVHVEATPPKQASVTIGA